MSDESSLNTVVSRQQHTAVTLQIVGIVAFTFIAYLTIGIPLAVLPGYVHTDLGYGSLLAGVAISTQYLATIVSRALAGRMADTAGPKQTVLYGLSACAVSGVLMTVAALLQTIPLLSLLVLLLSRLALGLGESWVATGAILWGIGRVGPLQTARVISWNGITTYGALAIGAPLGVVLAHSLGFVSIGITMTLLALVGLALANAKVAVAVVVGERLPFRSVFRRVLPHGIGLALGSAGFGSIATFITLYYASRHWSNAALSLSLFGLFFVGTRLVFPNVIRNYGGFRVAIVSFAIEAAGLLLLAFAPVQGLAMAGAALAGAGFALVFPALAVQAVELVPAASRGSALSAYSVFLDVSLGVTGPLAGLLVAGFGYRSVFLCAAGASVLAVCLTLALLNRSRGIRPAALA